MGLLHAAHTVIVDVALHHGGKNFDFGCACFRYVVGNQDTELTQDHSGPPSRLLSFPADESDSASLAIALRCTTMVRLWGHKQLTYLANTGKGNMHEGQRVCVMLGVWSHLATKGPAGIAGL